MNQKIKFRTLDEADYLLKYGGTVRSLAIVFRVSKSTVHHDLSVRLKQIDLDLYKRVGFILKINLNDRHIRGGKSTKIKYEKMRKNCQKLTKKTK